MVPLTLLLSRPPLAAKPEISDHLPKAPDPLCGAMFVRQEGACDHLPFSCTFFFFCTLRLLWAFCRMTVLPYFGHKRLNTAFWARLVLGCHLPPRSGTRGLTEATVGYLGGESRASSGPSRLLIHTFPLSLRRLPLAAIKQVVAVAGLAVAAVLQHLRVTFDVDEPLGLQFMKRSPRCGFRTSAGIGYSPDPRLTGIPASGTAGVWQREMFRIDVSAKEAVLPF